MAHSVIPKEELEVFKALPEMKVVFDVGARTDTDYFEIHPEAEYHLFEPNPDFFIDLRIKVGDRKNVYLNNYGLGEVEGVFGYQNDIQAFTGGEAYGGIGNQILPIKTLDWYVKENKIEQIDFLKIDAEGYEYRVLLGGKSIIPKCKYIQYEHWNNKQEFHDLLESNFDMEYIGFRNVLCMNKELVDEKTRQNLKDFFKERKFSELA